ncbi:MAG: hypothetical protein AAGB16_07270, partial [Pseudomonadota bacterium]
MKRFIFAFAAFGLVACGLAGADDDMAGYKEQAINVTPIQNAIASSNTFYFCKAHPSKQFDILCEACDVSLHDDVDEAGNVVGMKAWATHYYHELKPWNEGEAPRITTTGERADEKFVASEPAAAAAHIIFEKANTWCQVR